MYKRQMYRSARGAFEQVDQNLVAAARTLGMSEWGIFWKVLMTGGLPGVVSGGVSMFGNGISFNRKIYRYWIC